MDAVASEAARSTAVPAPGPSPRLGPDRLRALAGSLATVRSAAVAVALVMAAAGAYAAARETSVFALRTVEVTGARPGIAAQVRRAVAPLVGTSLVSLDGAELDRRLAALPLVEHASHDRAFPHRLRIAVRPERPLAVLRRGAESWLLSARGRVVATLRRGSFASLPRIWVPPATRVELGAPVSGDAAWAASNLARLLPTRFLRRVRTVDAERGNLRLVLRSGTELRLGAAHDIRLQVAVAERIFAAVPGAGRGPGYVDLALPTRPVMSVVPQVEG